MGIKQVEQRHFITQNECEKTWESCKVPGKIPLKPLVTGLLTGLQL